MALKWEMAWHAGVTGRKAFVAWASCPSRKVTGNGAEKVARAVCAGFCR